MAICLKDVDDFIALQRRRGCSVATIVSYCQAFRTFFAYAEGRGLCANGLPAGIQSPRATDRDWRAVVRCTDGVQLFPPDYVIPQTAINAPEFGLGNTGSIIPRLDLADYIMHNSTGGLFVDFTAAGPFASKAADAGTLVDYLGVIFMHSQMPTDMRKAIVDYISMVPASDATDRASLAAYLVVTSSQYKIMH